MYATTSAEHLDDLQRLPTAGEGLAGRNLANIEHTTTNAHAHPTACWEQCRDPRSISQLCRLEVNQSSWVPEKMQPRCQRQGPGPFLAHGSECTGSRNGQGPCLVHDGLDQSLAMTTLPWIFDSGRLDPWPKPALWPGSQ